jgi:hypothetical protein
METPSALAARRAIEIEWQYTTDPHLFAESCGPYFRSREDPDEHLWTYSFVDNTSRMTTHTGTLGEMEMDIASRCR